MNLLKYWSQALSAIGGGTLVFVIMWSIWSADAALTRIAHQEEVRATEARAVAVCEKDKLITQEANNAYLQKVNDLSRRLDAAKRVRKSECVPVARQARSGNATSGDTRLPVTDAVPASDLLDFAADAERVAQQLDACQKFIDDTWSSR